MPSAGSTSAQCHVFPTAVSHPQELHCPEVSRVPPSLPPLTSSARVPSPPCGLPQPANLLVLPPVPTQRRCSGGAPPPARWPRSPHLIRSRICNLSLRALPSSHAAQFSVQSCVDSSSLTLAWGSGVRSTAGRRHGLFQISPLVQCCRSGVLPMCCQCYQVLWPRTMFKSPFLKSATLGVIP